MSSTIRSNRSTIRSTMRSKEYWARRAEERADKHHEELETYLKRIDSIVNGACGRLKKDAETILNKCVARMGMSREETIKLMQEPVDYESLQRMLKTIEHMPEGAEKRKIQNQVEAKAYGYRVSRIEALEIDIKAESVRLAQRLTEATSNSLKHTAINAIKWTEKDLKELLGGASISFQKVNPTLIDELIHNSWSGKDFSERIWKNCEILEKNLNSTLKEGLLSGKGTYRIAEELADNMDCGKYAAQRLVRTETTHVYNEVDRKKYNEAGIEEYEYLACLDERTSEICKRLNGKRFKVDDAKPGVNYPPMHPNCRSTTVAVLDNVWGKEESIPYEKERPIYRGDKAINSDLNYIKSQEYRMRFHGITGNEKVDDKIWEYSKEILEHRTGTFKEDLILVNMDTGAKIYEIKNSISDNSVDYDKDIIYAIQKAKNKGIKILSLHNHPEGYPPTIDDGVSAKIKGYTKGVVCGHNGTIYEYEPCEEIYNYRQCVDIHNNIVLQLYDNDIDKTWLRVLKLNKMKVRGK